MTTYGKINNEVIGSHTHREFYDVLKEQGFTCFWCGSPICDPDEGAAEDLKPKNKAVEDHLLPKSRGGVDFIWNIVGSCQVCNNLRNNRLPGEFLQDRLAFSKPPQSARENSTAIPLFRERMADGRITTHSHLELSDFAAQVIRNLDRKIPQMEMTNQQFTERKRFLLDQSAKLLALHYRKSLEEAGQMVLPLKVGA